MGCLQRLLLRLFLQLILVSHASGVVVKSSHVSRSWRPKLKGRLFGAGNTAEKGDKKLGGKEATCFETFRAPEKGSRVCPSQCPFMQYDLTGVCLYRCVTADQCMNAPGMPPSIPDAESGICGLCKVPGCEQCALNANKCVKCEVGYDFDDGWCLPRTRWTWRVFYVVLGIVVVSAVAWLVQLARRPVVNQIAVDAALMHRSRSKIHNEDEERRLYPLRTNLCSEFIPQGGIGVLLHFRFQRATVHWALLVAMIMGYVAFKDYSLEGVSVMELEPQHEEVFETCLSLDSEDRMDMEIMRRHFLYATAFIYIVSFVGALLFAINQRRAFVEATAGVATMSNFALFCQGFPREPWGPAAPQQGREGLEDEYTKFFRDSPWGDSVLGVSIAWDLHDRREEVVEVLDNAIARMEAEHRGDGPVSLQPPPARSCPCLPDIESKLLGVESSVRVPPREEEEAAEDAENGPPARRTSRSWRGPAFVERFTDMETTGGVFVIFDTHDDLLKAVQTPVPKFRGTHAIRVQQVDYEPATVLWDGFNVTRSQRVMHVLKGLVCLMVLMLVWAVVFWGPYAYYVLSWAKVAGSVSALKGFSGILESTVLGLLITVGNQLVYAACTSIATGSRFLTTDSRDKMAVVLYTFAVSLNTVLDVGLITLLAHRFQQSSGMDEAAFIRNPSTQHALFVQLTSYIFPGTILLPYLVEPVTTCIAPFFLFTRLIRSRPDVTSMQAQKCLECPPFDLNRYGDMIINLVLCNLIFFLTSVNIWSMFAQLFVSCVVMCMWDRYRFLRESRRTQFATNKMDVCAQYLTVFPCAVLAGGLAFKYQGGQAMVNGWGREAFLAIRVEWIIVFLAMFAHTLVHTLLLYFVVPLFAVQKVEPEPITYAALAEKSSCSWFNANPMHCMRSLHYYCHRPPHVCAYPGRSHLHRANPDIHAYYEAPEDIKAAQSMLRNIMSEASEHMEQGAEIARTATVRDFATGRTSSAAANRPGSPSGSMMPKTGSVLDGAAACASQRTPLVNARRHQLEASRRDDDSAGRGQ